MQTKEDEEKKNIRQTLELYFHNNCITSIWIGDKRILRKLYTGVDKLRILPWFLDVFEAPFYPFVCIKCETIFFFSSFSLIFCVLYFYAFCLLRIVFEERTRMNFCSLSFSLYFFKYIFSVNSEHPLLFLPRLEFMQCNDTERNKGNRKIHETTRKKKHTNPTKRVCCLL